MRQRQVISNRRSFKSLSLPSQVLLLYERLTVRQFFFWQFCSHVLLRQVAFQSSCGWAPILLMILVKNDDDMLIVKSGTCTTVFWNWVHTRIIYSPLPNYMLCVHMCLMQPTLLDIEQLQNANQNLVCSLPSKNPAPNVSGMYMFEDVLKSALSVLQLPDTIRVPTKKLCEWVSFAHGWYAFCVCLSD